GLRGGSRRRNGRFAFRPGCIAKVKKLQWHTKFGEITVLEPQYRFGNNRVRPFVQSAKVSPRSCSRPLQRAITDFAADQPFAVARMKLLEHYGFEIGESTIQKDKRKGKTLSWREAKISLAHAKGSRTPIYGGGIEGGVEAAGRQLLAC